jgi:hypothetical protein
MADEKADIRAFDLLSRARGGGEITIRDDQADFAVLLDAAKVCRESGGRFRLIDTAKLGLSELEWLGQAGADLYTSDEARAKSVELGLLARACSRGKAIIAYFHHGPLGGESGQEAGTVAFLKEAGRSGVDIHLSNRDKRRHVSDLAEIASSSRKAGTLLVYYHHGRPAEDLEPLARSGGWIHLDDQSIEAAEDAAPFIDLARQALLSGAGLAIHIEKGTELDLARELFEAGAYLLFRTPPADYRSAFRALERRARKRTLPSRAYYLYTTFLP